MRHLALLAGALLVVVFGIPSVAAPSGYPPSNIVGTPVRVGNAFYTVASAGGNACENLQIYLPPSQPGPSAGCGAILRSDANGKSSVAHLFTPDEGAWPFSLRAGADGTLLGVTTLGGAYGRGTSFRFDPTSNSLVVLQSLAEPASLGSFGNAYAFDDGSVVAEDNKNRHFLLLAAGKAARVLASFRDADLGPFVVTPDGRATFLLADDPSYPACRRGSLLSLGRDGSVTNLSQKYHKTHPCTRNAAFITALQLPPITVARDGSLVTNDENYIFVARPGHDLERAYPAGGPGYFESGSAKELPSGDISFAAGDATQPCAIMHVRPGSAPVVKRCTAAQTKAAIVPAGPQSTSLFDIEYFTSLDLSSDPASGISATYSGSASNVAPNIAGDARAIDFELADANDASAAPVRLYPPAGRVATAEVDQPDFKYLEFSVIVAVPDQKPGLYRLTVRPGAALRASDGRAVPYAKAEVRGYIYFAPPATAGADADVDEARAAYAGHDVTVKDAVTLLCGSNSPTYLPGDRLHVVSIVRSKTGARIGYGPLGTIEQPAGDAEDAIAPFLAVHPVAVVIAGGPNATDPCEPVLFSDFAGIQRVLTPIPERRGSLGHTLTRR